MNTIKNFVRQMLNYIVNFYILLMIVVLPFYYQDGYNHIGTDKSVFFRTWSVRTAKVLLPALGVYLLLSVVELLPGLKNGAWKQWTVKSAVSAAVKFCREEFCLTDIFAFLYGASCILSYCCSDYKATALWGTSGWYMGLIPQLTLITIYFVTAHCRIVGKWMFYLFFPVSAVVFVLGILNRFGVYPIEMTGANPSFISTIGNINWYCGYMVSVLFAGVGLLWLNEDGKRWKQILLAGYVAIGFMTLITNGSSSGVLALAAVLLVMFCLSAEDGRRMQRFWMIMLILAAVCGIIWGIRGIFPKQISYVDASVQIFTDMRVLAAMMSVSMLLFIFMCWTNAKGTYPQRSLCAAAKILKAIIPLLLLFFIGMLIVNTNFPGSLGRLSEWQILTFNDNWGSKRGAAWGIGWKCFMEQDFLHRIAGIGPDCMADFLYQNGSVELLSWIQKVFGNARLTNAHNEWLTILVNTGMLGCISYAGMLATAALRLLEQALVSKSGMNVAATCGLCVLAYTTNSMFSFQQTMGAVTVFIVMGIGMAYEK